MAFNMILRMSMQTFLALSIQMWESLRDSYTIEVKGTIDLCIAILMLTYTIASVIFPYWFLKRNF